MNSKFRSERLLNKRSSRLLKIDWLKLAVWLAVIVFCLTFWKNFAKLLLWIWG